METQRALEQALSNPIHDAATIALHTATLEKAYKEEEMFWKQRSRIAWLNSGDLNTKYFHAITRDRRTCNRFTVIEDEAGTPYYKEKDISHVITEYFHNIFSSNGATNLDIVSEAIQPCVTNEMNKRLILIPTDEEIKSATFSINAEKALGPDGFSGGFFHSFWTIIKEDICKEVRDFFTSQLFPKQMNETHIRLIPKITGPRKVADYRPIALCNTYYKIVAKILTSRLQPILSNLISENQSAFVPKKAISDNVLITHEILHYLKISGARKRGAMAVKTDMSKAYDRIEWSFLKEVCIRMGFHEVWINWIMECVSTVSYSFLINGSPQGKVLPTRGLRQGDPLSPYLFILCTEVLSGLCRAAQEKCDLPALAKILKSYELASGQSINVAKSSITFASKTARGNREKVKRVLRITKEGGTGKYLGLPENFGRRKRDIFTSIVDRIRQRSQSWSSRFLSSAGKQILLKSVLSSMPSYAMSCFKIPTSLCKRIQSILTRFWWDDKPDKRKMAWISWEKMTIPKNAGGLGFRDIEDFNDALLAKLSWRVLSQPDSLLSRILRGKYCHKETFLKCSALSNASHGWRGILAGRGVLKKGLGWLIGDGESVNVWEDPWLSLQEPLVPYGPVPRHLMHLKVSQLINMDDNTWNWNRIRLWLPQYEDHIRKLLLSFTKYAYLLVWLPAKNGEYTTKSGYGFKAREASSQQFQEFNWQKNLWRTKTQPKIKSFLWKAIVGALPVGDQIQRRGMGNALCPRCGANESIEHTLFHCQWARSVWAMAPISPFNGLQIDYVLSFLSTAQNLKVLPSTNVTAAFLPAWVCWNIWTARNKLIFEDITFTTQEVVTKAIKDARIWQEAQEHLTAPRPPETLMNCELPLQDLTVCYVDAAWLKEKLSGGAGWWIRESHAELHEGSRHHYQAQIQHWKQRQKL